MGPREPLTPGTTPPLAELPVTRSMLYAVRDETSARIDRVEAGVNELRGTLHELFAFVRDQAKR